MKKFSRITATMLMLAIALTIFVVPASAASVSASGSSFTKDWERYAASSDGLASLTYGYNTFLIYEDYAWGNHSTRTHYAAVTNGNGSFSGPNKGPGSESKIEVTHNGTSVSYYCYY